MLGPAPNAKEGEREDGEEKLEKACQNVLPRHCMSVWEAIDVSTACCAIRDNDDDAEVNVELSLGVEGGMGYTGAKEDGITWCLPLREKRVCITEELCKDAVIVK